MKRIVLLACAIIILSIGACTPTVQDQEAPVIQTGIDPESWAFVSAGEFYMGQHAHETPVDHDYEIMVTHVTNEQFARFLNEALDSDTIELEGANPVGYYPGDTFHGGRHEEEVPAGDYLLAWLEDPTTRIIEDGKGYAAKTGYQNHPVAMMTWFGAKAYCEYYGWRLPTEQEWEKAARGTDTQPYPWGNEIGPANANYYSSHDIFEKLAGKSDTTPVGYYNGRTYGSFATKDSASPYGLYDMAGNLWQWTADVYEYQHYRYMRGGSKENYAYNLRVWTRNSAGPEYYSPNVGFRCVREP
jgi:formylglycine-generating enzyme required for sulfatase activity